MNILLEKKYCPLINMQIIKQAQFTNYPLGKAFEKQKKTIEDKEKSKYKQFKIQSQLNQSKNLLMTLMIVQ